MISCIFIRYDAWRYRSLQQLSQGFVMFVVCRQQGKAVIESLYQRVTLRVPSFRMSLKEMIDHEMIQRRN